VGILEQSEDAQLINTTVALPLRHFQLGTSAHAGISLLHHTDITQAIPNSRKLSEHIWSGKIFCPSAQHSHDGK